MEGEETTIVAAEGASVVEASETNENDVAIAQANADAAVEISANEAAATIAQTEILNEGMIAASQENDRWQEMDGRLSLLATQHTQMAEQLGMIEGTLLTLAASTQPLTEEVPSEPENNPEPLSDASQTAEPESDAPAEPEPVPEPKRRHRWI